MGEVGLVGDIAATPAPDFAGPGRAVERTPVGQVGRVRVDAVIQREVGCKPPDQRFVGIKAAAQKGGCNQDDGGADHGVAPARGSVALSSQSATSPETSGSTRWRTMA